MGERRGMVMRRDEIVALGYQHGGDYADHHWQIWPAHYTEAVEWCAAAEAGTVHLYGLPDLDAQDEIPADIDTAEWSWEEMAEYQRAWDQAFYARLTELCRNVIEAVTA